ncbi:hypothetical protein SAMN04515618_1149 [Collimonas sp. OK307]|uniref:hypothetical protein n=1 Tax=Collimonas sp. OK307 TaxID=1801620 RepID=UPI0008F21172|nr:hypothetical protein [Collimonas sp. OK307]SFI22026.1 hypothetical protein SAMN04515618_1149 [Collimonas sp. OK307]
MKPRHILLAAGVLVAAWLALYGDKTPSGGIAEPLTHGAPKISTHEAASVKVTSTSTTDTASTDARYSDTVVSKQEIVIQVLRSRAELIGGRPSEKQMDALFDTHSWMPIPSPQSPFPPSPPTAPPLPFTFLGKKIEGVTWEVYLARGEQTFIVHEQSTIDDSYRVDAIRPPTMTLTYLPLKQVQSLSIGGVE